MKEGTNDEYMEILAALGATLAKRKSDLSLAKYDIDRLRKKLDEAEKELWELKKGKNNERERT